MKFQCVNIKCQGCVSKIQEALSAEFPDITIDIPSQVVEAQADEEGAKKIKEKLSELGFLPSEGFGSKLKKFFTK